MGHSRWIGASRRKVHGSTTRASIRGRRIYTDSRELLNPQSHHFLLTSSSTAIQSRADNVFSLPILSAGLFPLALASPLDPRWGEGVPDALGTLAEQAGKLYFGTAFSSWYAADTRYGSALETQFNQYTPENEMKWEVIEPLRGVFNFTGSDLVGLLIGRNGSSPMGIDPWRGEQGGLTSSRA